MKAVNIQMSITKDEFYFCIIFEFVFQDSPCILCNGETTVEVTDYQGYKCTCSACPPVTIVKTRCKCTADGQVDIDTE